MCSVQYVFSIYGNSAQAIIDIVYFYILVWSVCVCIQQRVYSLQSSVEFAVLNECVYIVKCTLYTVMWSVQC